MYEQSLSVFADAVEAASIPVDQIAGDVVLAAGGDDQVWPSQLFAEQIATRRREHGLATTVLSHPDAGHRLQLPGEGALMDGALARGGTPLADCELGARLWLDLVGLLDLRG